MVVLESRFINNFINLLPSALDLDETYVLFDLSLFLEFLQVIAELLRTRKDNSYDFDLNTDKPNSHFKLERAPPEKKVKTDPMEKNREQDADCSENLNSTIEDDIIECSSKDQQKSDIQSDMGSLVKIKPEINSSKDLNMEGNILNVTNNKEKINESPSNRERGHATYTSRELGEQYFDEDCTECKRTWKEPFLSELVMYLHAYSYKVSATSSINKYAKADVL